jgi:hypothetical protein
MDLLYRPDGLCQGKQNQSLSAHPGEVESLRRKGLAPNQYVGAILIAKVFNFGGIALTAFKGQLQQGVAEECGLRLSASTARGIINAHSHRTGCHTRGRRLLVLARQGDQGNRR